MPKYNASPGEQEDSARKAYGAASGVWSILLCDLGELSFIICCRQQYSEAAETIDD